MSTPQSRPSGQRGARTSRGPGGRRGTAQATQVQKNGPLLPVQQRVVDNKEEIKGIETVEELAVCWICAEPVKYYSVSDCNHRTCHVCALRLRALYKKNDCTFCKTPQPSVIFTRSSGAEFSSFTPESIPYKDSKLSIFFETQEMMEETLILLRFNCPDLDCDYIGTGWSDLKLHIRATHGKLLCDLCIRFKKVFAHEHALYVPSQLPIHLPSIAHRQRHPVPKEQVEGGIHPLCEFCRECFFSDDELFTHMRERHEECFICKRNNVRDQYFQNYDNLEKHFLRAHHPCTQPQCHARKFVVFNSELDLKAHMVEEHSSDMTSRDKKDVRRIQAEFDFEEVGIGGRRGRRDRGDREREREPPPHQPTPTIRTNGRRREGFGANLTTDGGQNTPATNSSGLNHRSTPSPPLADVDPVVAERHAAFMARVWSLAPNPTTAVPAVKAAVRGYRASESSARDLISTFWNVMDENLDDTASVVNALVDLLDDEKKKKDMLNAWNGFKIEQRRHFPDLVPTALGSGYAGITGGRVLNFKLATASRSSHQSSRQVWDRVAQAAGSSSLSGAAPVPRPPPSFPPLQPIPIVAGVPSFRQPARNTPWSASSASGTRAPSSVPAPGSISRPDSRDKPRSGAGSPAPPKLSNESFPELPASSAARSKATVSGNQSLKNILGESAPVASAWQTNNASSGTPSSQTPLEDAASGDVGSGKGKKGKGKQKQMLFTLGTFPS